MIKTLDITYARADLNQVGDNATQLDAEERTQLLRLLEDFKDLFGGTLVDLAIESIELELKPGYKPYNIKYYLVAIINKETFCRELKRLVVTGELTTVQYSQYGTTVFIIPRK